jgi:hypothetical protein
MRQMLKRPKKIRMEDNKRTTDNTHRELRQKLNKAQVTKKGLKRERWNMKCRQRNQGTWKN